MIKTKITKTSEEAQRQREAHKKDEEKKRESRYCPECGKFQLFRSKIVKEFFGDRAPIHKGYSYKCKCGCEWQCYRFENGRY